ncbi:hypothetical protein [Plastoroseomonas arctica]|uniref:Uncharacterized protein n=1 Tax=Plastoroseomonas arctica TaxID=1509237 RepID=A0AAF1KLV7_9PROT|nr:hypothetical protein [Plastoroseomonas arctica]MBR0655256.1 hypothetical protein [Plastoroseomonas arctica]
MTDRDTAPRTLTWLAWLATAWIAWELLHDAQSKLTGNEGSVYLFTVLTDGLGFPGYERAIQLGVAVAAMTTAIFVLISRSRGFAGLMAEGIMGGVVVFHRASPLCVDPYGDGGALFRDDQIAHTLARHAGPRRAVTP